MSDNKKMRPLSAIMAQRDKDIKAADQAAAAAELAAEGLDLVVDHADCDASSPGALRYTRDVHQLESAALYCMAMIFNGLELTYPPSTVDKRGQPSPLATLDCEWYAVAVHLCPAGMRVEATGRWEPTRTAAATVITATKTGPELVQDLARVIAGLVASVM
jgi:hypothetical protein